ncbi:MAG TPA: 23S rRNA (adenine(2503)-C(2))-methyltransferase RlmN [Tepidiformaceae bacterium]
MTDLFRLLPTEMDELMVKLDQPRYRADQVLHSLYHEAPTCIAEIRQIPAALRAQLEAEGYTIGSATEARRVMSKDGLTTKLLLEMEGGTLLETVLMQYPATDGGHPRSTVCVSTQAGCAMGCVFCATGQMGFERNLKAEELVAQVVGLAQVLRARNEHITNVVFMGMGEPLANYKETIRAIRLLTDARAFGLGQRNITVSTVGVISGIDRLADEDLQVGLAISLHAPNDELRRKLVPTANEHSVGDLLSAARRYFKKTGRRVTFEYAMLAGVNDSPETASEFGRLLRGTGIHVNLIPVNPTPRGHGRPARRATLEFERVLREAGVNCTIRVEKGTEISAACGQLRTTEGARSVAVSSAD